jgi:hypothetical protein
MRFFSLLSSSVVALAMLGTAGFAASSLPCSKHDDLVKVLDSKYREGLSGFGLAGQTSLVEVYVSKDGSFTILATNPKGISCVLATGQNWEKVTPAVKLTSS